MQTMTEIFEKQAKEIREGLKKRLRIETIDHHIHTILLSLIKKSEGKKPTKRLATALKDACPELAGPTTIVSWDTSYGQNRVVIWGTPEHPNYNDRNSFFVGYDSNPLSSEDFENKHDVCHAKAAERRIEHYKKLIDSDWPERVVQACNEFKEAKAYYELVVSEDDNPFKYEVEKILGTEKKG